MNQKIEWKVRSDKARHLQRKDILSPSRLEYSNQYVKIDDLRGVMVKCILDPQTDSNETHPLHPYTHTINWIRMQYLL